MQIHHLNCGTFCPMGAKLINGEGGLLERGRLVCHCLLVETPAGLVLVDTGLGTSDLDFPEDRLPGRLWQAINQAQLRPEETAIAQVRALGFDPRDVRHIVVTHLDFDHAGGLADFPKAQVYVYEDELQTALNPRRYMEKRRYARGQFAHDPVWRPQKVDGETWFGFRSVRPLSPEIPQVAMIPLVGHSRGHCGVAVDTGDGWLLLAGDAVFHRDELRPDAPSCPLGLRIYQKIFLDNEERRRENQERLRDLVRQYGHRVRVIPSHDPAPLEEAQLPTNRAYAG